MVISCVGGGSNAAGAFYHFMENESVKLIAAEAAGMGVNSGKSAATSLLGTNGILHGSRTRLMQTEDGQVIEPYSVSAGLDYPGIGPLHRSLSSDRTRETGYAAFSFGMGRKNTACVTVRNRYRLQILLHDVILRLAADSGQKILDAPNADNDLKGAFDHRGLILTTQILIYERRTANTELARTKKHHRLCYTS